MFTIKGAAEQVGVSAPTLRAWERRYGIIEPTRTDGGYRVYSAEDVEVLRLMAALIDQGRPPSLAAVEAKRQRPDAQPPTATPAPPEVSGLELVPALVHAAQTLDPAALTTVLDAMFGRTSFESIVDSQLLPAMSALGEAWSAGSLSVAGEHLTANAVMRRLASAYDAAAGTRGGPRVIVGLPPGSHHEVGLFAFAVAARRRGLNVDYLGADLPIEDWISAAQAPTVAAAVISIPTDSDLPSAVDLIGALRSAAPNLLIAVGGGEQDRAPTETIRLGHEVGPAAQALDQHVRNG